MLSMFNRIRLFIPLFFLFFGCEDKIEFPAEPVIEILNITPAAAQQYTDPVIITIKYEDGDGDLGENNDQVKNCFVTDNRIGITYEYRIKQLAPSGANIPISGNLNIDIGGQVLTDSSTQQNATYTLFVVDRAGHQSNSITTSPITIRR